MRFIQKMKKDKSTYYGSMTPTIRLAINCDHLIKLLLVFFLCVSSFAKAEKSNSRYFYMSGVSSENGLSHNYVNTIFKDSRGFLWFGTFDGLNLYNGNTCKKYLYTKTEGSTYQNKLIHSIYEDRDGYLWIGTNGYQVYTFNHTNEEFEIHALPVNDGLANTTTCHIYKILQDNDGVMWFGTSIGLFYLKPDSDKIESFVKWNEHYSIAVETLISDKFGNLWIGTKGEGLFKITNDFILKIQLGVDFKYVTDLHLDNDDNLWIATAGNGLLLYNLQTEDNHQYLVKNLSPGSLPNRINEIIPRGNAEYLLATFEGIYVFKKQTKQFSDFNSHHSFPHYPQNLNFNALFLDNQNVLWAATSSSGVYKYYLYHDGFNHLMPYPEEKNDPRNTIHTVIEKGDKIFLGSESGILTTGRQSGKIVDRIVPPNYNQKKFVITKLCEYSNDTLLIGTWGHGLWIYTINNRKLSRVNIDPQFQATEIFEVFVDKDKNTWLGLHEGGLLKLNQQLRKVSHYVNTNPYQTISGRSVRKIIQDQNGKLWIGSLDAGIDVFNPQTGEYYNVVNYYQGNSQISNNDIMSLLEDSKGNIWIGTNGGGVNLYLRDSQEFVHLSEKEGIINNTIFSINEDSNGNIWLQTNRGITRLNYYSKSSLPVPSSRNFDIKDGLPNTEFLFSTSHKADDGRLYFPSRYGVICFYPEELIENDLPPKIVITDIEINNKSYTNYFNDIGLQPRVKNANYLNSLELNHSMNRINIEFAALDYFNPSDNQYLAKLEGFDEDWVLLGSNSNVSYNNLSPGEYILLIKAGNSHNIWNEKGISLHIIINPPWWSTWWAYSLYVILSVVVLILFRHQAIKRERVKNKQRMERMQLEKQLELDKFKLDFFTKITHEIRTPITLIMGPLEKMLQKNREDKEDQKYFKILKSNSDKLYHLTNELLDIRKIDEGKYTLHKTTDDLLPFLQEIISRFSSMVETKKINLTFESNCKSIFWEFDLTAIDRIISNIISNAIKFTDYRGDIHISCNLKERKNKPGRIIIQIKDTGRGIARDDLNEIFKPFYQTRSTESHTIPGTGLGLALVKELCDLHNGKIKVKSKLGKGSTFSLHFDNNLAQLNKTTELVKDSTWLNEYRSINEVVPVINEPTAIAAKYKVLVVEDNQELNDFLQTLLSDNFKVYSCANGADGYNKAKEIIPDLIISDVMMPVMNGIEMCHKLKQEPLTCHIPILLLTVMANEESQMTGYEAGADDYIAKPFNASILQMKVQNLLNLKNNLRMQFAKTFLVDSSQANENDIDPLIAKIISFIEENLDDADLNILQIQKEVGVGRSQLFAKIKNITGLTITELIQGIRLKKAFGFLSTGKYTVSQTAYMVGFKNLSHFTRLFKDRFGHVPSEVAKG